MTAPFTFPPHHSYPDVSWSDLRTEIQREIAQRHNAFPAMVAKGKLTQVEADRQLDIFQAILEDLRRFQQATSPAEGQRAANPLSLARLHAYTWNERRAAITRELDYRQHVYPRQISKGQLTTADAERFTHRLTCMRAVYELGYDFEPRSLDRALGGTLIDWLAVETEIAARDGRAQEALAL